MPSKIARTTAIRGTLLFAALAAVLITWAASTASAETRNFNWPRYKGYLVDHCLTWGSNCDWPAAHRFCQLMGFQRATKWRWNYRHPTLVLGTGQICNIARGCGAFSMVTCMRGGGRRGGRKCHTVADCPPNHICLLGVCARP